MTLGMLENDLVRFVLRSHSLDYPISLPFMPMRELNANRIMAEVFQSNEIFKIEDGMNINIIHISMPMGGVSVRKRKHYAFKLDKFLKKKGCVIRILNSDICLSRAIVTDIARQEKWDRHHSIRQGRAIHGVLATDLHQRAGVPLRMCGLPEVEMFQRVIDQYQLVVLSAEHFNAIVYEGPKRDEKIFLFYHNNHFDIITALSTFLERSYYCFECKIGYNSADAHHCEGTCKCCFSTECNGKVNNAPWRECGSCNRIFAGDECYERHCVPNKEGNSICSKYYRCKACKKVLAYSKRHPRDHKCGEVYCFNCKDFFRAGHLCHMQKLETEEEKRERKREEKRRRGAEKRAKRRRNVGTGRR
ncbi:predicted protein [Nematostella vectensis]|uniref:DNA-directed DNA polymerase n=1 Tax=Nematostella vectensis TaxID=45351 RepID=A7SAE5_NEMVE|nr:predicted protein [Nematostella vectensis]|eukprot:XP_001631327.1 predicted protein [Nematostella vectensis]